MSFAELLVILGFFVVKHFFGDFVLQRHRHYSTKGIYGAWGGIEHALIHGCLTFFVLAFYCQVPLAVIMAVLDSLTHYHIDYIKTKFGPKDNTRNIYWVWFGADQVLHYLTYLVIMYLLWIKKLVLS